jgi:hypothetical protein
MRVINGVGSGRRFGYGSPVLTTLGSDKVRLNPRTAFGFDMSAALRRPTDRTCERCGRAEQWNPKTDSWEIADNEPGSIYCIHEWDINGRFMPFDDE